VHPYATTGWEDFFTASAGAAATLTGLVFVGLSINLSKILAAPGLPGRAGEAITILAGGLLVSTLALIPGQSARLLGSELLALGLFVWAIPTGIQVLTLVRREWAQPTQMATRVMLGQLATLPFLIAAVSLLMGVGGGIYWMVPGVILSYIAGVVAAWVLLIEILR
jgi:hypothetical protein